MKKFSAFESLANSNPPSPLTTLSVFDPFLSSRSQLAISQNSNEILSIVKKFDCSLIESSPFSGKTSVIGSLLVEKRYALPPRKIYLVTHSPPPSETRISTCTYSQFIEVISLNSALRDIGAVVVDDVDHRNMFCDLLVSLLLKIAAFRKKEGDVLKVIFLSCHSKSSEVANFFESQTKELELSFRKHSTPSPIQELQIRYLKTPVDVNPAHLAQTLKQIHASFEKDRGVLIYTPNLLFSEAVRLQIDRLSLKDIVVEVIHPLQPLEKQNQIFCSSHSGQRKVLISSHPLPPSQHLTLLIDSMLCEVSYFDPDIRGAMARVIKSPKSVSSKRAYSMQGHSKKDSSIRIVYRMCTESEFRESEEEYLSEVCRLSLLEFCRKGYLLNLKNPYDLAMITPLPRSHVVSALNDLFALGIIDIEGKLTQGVGNIATRLPLDVRLGTCLINSFKPEFACSFEMIRIVSCMSAEGLFLKHRDSKGLLQLRKFLGAKESDFVSNFNLMVVMESLGGRDLASFCQEWNLSLPVAQKAIEFARRLEDFFRLFLNQPVQKSDDFDAVSRCILTGYFFNVAQRGSDESYLLMGSNSQVFLSASSALLAKFPNLVIFERAIEASNHKVYIETCQEISPRDLIDIAGHYYEDLSDRQMEARYLKDANRGEEKPKLPVFSAKRKNVISFIDDD